MQDIKLMNIHFYNLDKVIEEMIKDDKLLKMILNTIYTRYYNYRDDVRFMKGTSRNILFNEKYMFNIENETLSFKDICELKNNLLKYKLNYPEFRVIDLNSDLNEQEDKLYLIYILLHQIICFIRETFIERF